MKKLMRLRIDRCSYQGWESVGWHGAGDRPLEFDKAIEMLYKSYLI